MNRVRPTFPVALAAWLLAIGAASADENRPEQGKRPAAVDALRIVVMDPLSHQLACDCVAGYAQRRYDKLAAALEAERKRPVHIVYAESLLMPPAGAAKRAHLIIGKFSVVVSDAARAELPLRTLAMLSDQNGSLTQHGLFVVRRDDPARSVAHLKADRILFGPADSAEKHAAAVASLEAFGVPVPAKRLTRPSCGSAALAVAEGDADAAVISNYAMRLLEGCGTIDKGALRVVGTTDPVPMVAVFATDRVGPKLEARVLESLLTVRRRPTLLAALQSADGFVRLPPLGDEAWADWRGPHRDAISPRVPKTLPSKRRFLWSRTCTGPGLAGLAVAAGRVVVTDKSLDQKHDVFRCLDADTGRQIWHIAYPAPGEMDFTNSPRATPVVVDGLVYLLGAFGHLHCVKLETGQIVWKRHLLDDFGAKRPTWGTCSTPLAIGEKLIVNPGAEQASLAALDRHTGEILWTTPGERPGYGSFLLAELGGVRQIVGYDAVSIGGWKHQTGERLWRLVPEWEGDFNVPTPIVLGGRLLVCTENNGTRLYGFDTRGRILPEPLAANEDLAPDTSTPVVLGRHLFGNFGGLWCLDLGPGPPGKPTAPHRTRTLPEPTLNTLWQSDEDPLVDYCSLLAGNERVLIATQSGELRLIRPDSRRLDCVSRLALFPDVAQNDRELWSHPALVGNRLYLRNLLAVYCLLLD